MSPFYGEHDAEAHKTSEGTQVGMGMSDVPPANGAVSNLLSFPWTHATPGNRAGFGQYHLKLEWTGRRGPPLALLPGPHIAEG